jgi:hypothetical protein
MKTSGDYQSSEMFRAHFGDSHKYSVASRFGGGGHRNCGIIWKKQRMKTLLCRPSPKS